MILFKSFTCGACQNVSGLSETMFNVSEADTSDHKRLILCRRDAQIAAKEKGLRVFRLSDTLSRDAKREAERRQSQVFWAAFNGRKATEKALRRPNVRIT